VFAPEKGGPKSGDFSYVQPSPALASPPFGLNYGLFARGEATLSGK